MTETYMQLEKFPHLLDPNALGGRLPTHRLGRAIGHALFAPDLERSAAEVAAIKNLRMPDLGVVVQARMRRHPRNLANRRSSPSALVENIEYTLDGIRDQEYANLKGVVVVLDESTHLTQTDRKRLSDTHLVRVPHEFNHAKAMNKGVRGLVHAVRPAITAITEAGALYATNQAFRAAASVIGQGVLGVYGARLAGEGASISESLLYGTSALFSIGLDKPDASPRPGTGFMAADRAAFMTGALVRDPFDEQFGRGGSDGHWGAQRQAERDDAIAYAPAMSVQYVEGLGPYQLASQVHEWMKYSRPNEYRP
jgi:hypothetical protein